MEQEEFVVLVNEQDEELGLMEKHEAHRKGVLHRAFSVFIFNEEGKLLLQQRGHHKYHSAGLWTNTCCSHPRINETRMEGAHRRLREEMGFDCPLEERFHFIYKAELENHLVEHELDFIYTGVFNGKPVMNPQEVETCKWISLDELGRDIIEHPEKYTSWIRIILSRYRDKLGPAV